MGIKEDTEREIRFRQAMDDVIRLYLKKIDIKDSSTDPKEIKKLESEIKELKDERYKLTMFDEEAYKRYIDIYSKQV